MCIWGGDTLHHHYIIHVHADLSTCHYNSLVPTALLPRPLTTVLIVVCAHMGRGHTTSSLHHTCTCRPQYMPLQLISAHCPPAQASHNCSHSCVCVRIWGGDTLHHHYIIHVHADLSTCHYNSLVPTALLPRPLTTVLIVVCVCAHYFPHPHRKILYETPPCFPIPRVTWCHALRSCFSIQPGNGKTGQGYIQNFSVGVGKIMHIELCPLGGGWGYAPPGKF